MVPSFGLDPVSATARCSISVLPLIFHGRCPCCSSHFAVSLLFRFPSQHATSHSTVLTFTPYLGLLSFPGRWSQLALPRRRRHRLWPSNQRGHPNSRRIQLANRRRRPPPLELPPPPEAIPPTAGPAHQQASAAPRMDQHRPTVDTGGPASGEGRVLRHTCYRERGDMADSACGTRGSLGCRRGGPQWPGPPNERGWRPERGRPRRGPGNSPEHH
jgi:hypothetical protein